MSIKKTMMADELKYIVTGEPVAIHIPVRTYSDGWQGD
jgi:hypothetical protein